MYKTSVESFLEQTRDVGSNLILEKEAREDIIHFKKMIMKFAENLCLREILTTDFSAQKINLGSVYNYINS